MPRAISNRPIIRVMTLIPVCPSKRTSHGAIRKIPQQQRANTAIASENPTRCTREWYRVPQTIVELIALARPLMVAREERRRCSPGPPSPTFPACSAYLRRAYRWSSTSRWSPPDAAGDTEGVNGDTENLQNAIAEEQRRQEDDRHRQVGGEVGLITHRSRLIAGHTDEYRNNANRVNQANKPMKNLKYAEKSNSDWVTLGSAASSKLAVDC